jgi:CheY-specific phosphatase CheX
MVLETVENINDQVSVIVEDVFLSMLGFQVQHHPSCLTEDEQITASVFLAGEWRGAVSIEMGMGQAIEITAQLNPESSPAGLDDDVRDAIGEVANMIGGNLKASLPGGTHMSMPTVVRGTDYKVRMCGLAESASFGFSTAYGPFWVHITHVLEN